MEDWEKALSKFILKWKNKKEVVGALVCGSFITGNPTKHSDIDLQILLDDSCNWRQRGNEIVDGFLIEYFVNPLSQNLKYFEDDYNLNKKENIHMFKTGKVLFDRNGDVKKIINEAKKWDKKKFKKQNRISIELSKYALWDMQDNLEEVSEYKKEDFYYVFYKFLDNVLFHYSNYLGFVNIPVYKVRRFLMDKKDKEKYQINDFPDKKFVRLFIKCMNLNKKEEMLNQYKILNQYILEKMGGFNINGWKIPKSPLDIKK